MAVAIRGGAQGTLPSGSGTIAWPAGTVAGDLALLVLISDGFGANPTSSGWTPGQGALWWKSLLTDDVASSLPVRATGYMLAVFSGAGAVGRSANQPGVTVTSGGSAIWVVGGKTSSNLGPSTYRLGSEFSDGVGYWHASYALLVGSGYQQLAGAASDAFWVAYEVAPATIPAAPAFLSPVSGARFSNTQRLDISWKPSGAQSAYRLRADFGGYYNWVSAAGTLVSGEEIVQSASPTAFINGGRLYLPMVPSIAVNLYVSTYDPSNGWSPYTQALVVNADDPPGASVTGVASPRNDLTPVVSYTATAGYGSITARRVFIAPAGSPDPEASAVWVSDVLQGSSSGPVSASASAPWVNGQQLEAWVRVWQTGGPTSLSGASDAFSVAWDAPGAPGVVVSPGAPMQVTVSGLQAGWVVEIQQSLDNGVSWEYFTKATSPGTTLTLPTILTATGSPVKMRARAASASFEDAPLYSGWGVSASVTGTPSDFWLVSDDDLTDVVQVSLVTDAKRAVHQEIEVAYGIGSSYPRVDVSPAAGETGDVTLRTRTAAEHRALLSWLGDHLSFWLVWPPDNGEVLPPTHAARSTPVAWSRVVQSPTTAMRLVSFGWVEKK